MTEKLTNRCGFAGTSSLVSKIMAALHFPDQILLSYLTNHVRRSRCSQVGTILIQYNCYKKRVYTPSCGRLWTMSNKNETSQVDLISRPQSNKQSGVIKTKTTIAPAVRIISSKATPDAQFDVIKLPKRT